MSALDTSSFTGVQKAAILLSLMGEEDAASILRNLPSGDLERVTEEVARLPRVPIELTVRVLEEYQQIMAAQDCIAMGGQDRAVRMLVKTLGENGAKAMVERITNPDAGATFSLASLKQTEPQQLARFLATEHAQTRALILSHLDPRQASSLMMQLDPDVRTDCVRRLASMGQFSPQAAARASEVLKRRFGLSGDHSGRANAGTRNLADLMNRLEQAAAREILESIEIQDPALAIKIRDLMFTFENFLEVPEPDLRELMNAIDKKTLMVALKGASQELRTHVYRTMSSRAVEMMKEDSEMMGPVRTREIAKAQAEIVAIARKLESEGKIVLKSEGEDEYVL